jgi:hypothetical protein
VPSKLFAGRCLCGAVRYECGEPVSSGALCHCESCRRAAGAHVVAWATVKRADYRIVQGSPREYASSAQVLRTFCERCGTQLTYRHDDSPQTLDITVSSLDDPDSIAPADHIWMEDAVSWDRPGDSLPQWPATRASARS